MLAKISLLYRIKKIPHFRTPLSIVSNNLQQWIVQRLTIYSFLNFTQIKKTLAIKSLPDSIV
ncbi:hypothetical protein BpHYR1_048721 [Brachionus plicatilis]|uniref:Uncharacterized protein n=1 Tax=Brachionus plicatilis TaxID=10195 RepID=A0A3M7PQ42_BRAPC|nr:hypothetical protein BpHYR1_048721 [Brachionus plicatilis]